MTDTLTSAERSERMSLIKSKGSSAEMTVRRLVHSLGYRYRLHARDLPGTPDLVFRARKKVIQVHGCFWHRHPRTVCPLARLPKSRIEFWKEKLNGNRKRDRKNNRMLRNLGWRVLEIWECELSNAQRLQSKILYFLDDDLT